MKRILAVVLAVVMVVSLVACGGNKTAEKDCCNCGEDIESDAAFCEYCGTAQNNTNMDSSNSNSYAGIYLTDDWNGKNAIIRLNEDGTCKTHMGETGTWEHQGKKIVILYIREYEGIGETKTETKTMELDIVKEGLIYSSMFFKRM